MEKLSSVDIQIIFALAIAMCSKSCSLPLSEVLSVINLKLWLEKEVTSSGIYALHHSCLQSYLLSMS